MEKREDLQLILLYLPVLMRSSSLFWPSQVVESLRELATGRVDSGRLLFIAISELRNSLSLSSEPLVLSSAHGYALFFDELMSREESRKWFEEVVPTLGDLLLRLPSLLETHYENADTVIDGEGDIVRTGLRLLDSQEAGIVFLSQVHRSGLIEDHSSEAVEVDFANEYLGGGALRRGCVQEEIRFMISPKLIAGMLFLPSMADNEAIDIVGVERFSSYTGLFIPTVRSTRHSVVIANGVKEFTDTVGGIGLEVRLILCEENADDEMTNWEVKNLKFFVKQPIEAIVTKDELQHLTFLCKSEIDSIGRITAEIIRLLKLEGSVGQSVIDQLGNLGSEGIDKIFSPEKASRDGSVGSRGLSPLPILINEEPHKTSEQTLTLLEEALMDSQAKLNDLISDIGTSESSSFHTSAACNQVKECIGKE